MKPVDAIPERKPAPVQQADAWDSIAEGWHDWIPQMRTWYAPATKLMLDLARIGPGDRILDIAAGDCDQSIAAAKRVGSDGHVLAIDMAPEMLEIGARQAQEQGFHNIETRVMDAENLDFPEDSFDAAICRFALMLLPNPTRAIEEIGRVLKSDARVSVVVYADEGAPEFLTALSAVQGILGAGEANLSVDSLGNPEVVRQVFKEGGLREVESHLIRVPVRMRSAEECVRYLKATSPTLADMVSKLSEKDRNRAWEEVKAELAQYELDGRFEVEHQVIVAAGTAS